MYQIIFITLTVQDTGLISFIHLAYWIVIKQPLRIYFKNMT